MQLCVMLKILLLHTNETKLRLTSFLQVSGVLCNDPVMLCIKPGEASFALYSIPNLKQILMQQLISLRVAGLFKEFLL